MKKYYLPFIALGLFSGTLFSQNTYVTGNAKVKVQPGTLFYHGGSFNVKAGANASKVIENAGNIRINGTFTNEVANGKNFVNTHTSETSYGQVIIAAANPTAYNSSNLNRLTMEKNAIDPGSNAWGQFAIPYSFPTVKLAYETIFNGASVYKDASRYATSIMTWDNTTRPEFDQILGSVAINPTDYVILNLTNDTDLMGIMDSGDALMSYSGNPANGPHNPTFNPTMYFPSEHWNTWKAKRNWYREQYVTYIQDPLRTADTQHYGRYIFQFGNPYTSNIDLSRIGINGDADNVYIADLLGVVKAVSGVAWDEDTGGGNATVLRRATFNSVSNTWAGDSDALIIKPFESFYIALNDAAGQSTRTFNFQDGLKTFSSVSALAPTGIFSLTGKNLENENSFGEVESTEDRAFDNSITSFATASRSSFYQLRLNLYSENDSQLGNSVFVVVDSNSQTGVEQVLESEYLDFYKGFFLVQENLNGTEIETPNRTMQINVVNPRYVAKPIQLFFKKSDSDISGYYVKAELFFKNIFNKLQTEDVNYPDGNSFFFYDKAQDILLPITADFSYYIERPEQNLSSRYAIYWNGGPEANSGKMSVSDELTGKTQVYKDGVTHKIRFDETWDSADIAVYDLSGRSILKKNGVKTDVDFTLDLPNTSTYVVKIQSNTGETVTQKILR